MSYIHVIGATAEAAELEAKEAERKRQRWLKLNMYELSEYVVKSLNLTEEEAIEIVMTERVR
jgi:hypothetical protein